jgi:glucose/arabinose dehydrogenase
MQRILSILPLVFFVIGAQAQMEIELDEFASGFNLPVDIVHHGTSDLYIVEKAGTIKILKEDGTVLPDNFLDITDRVNAGGSELGLLGMAFDPDYENNGRFYLNYTDRVGFTRISRFEVDPMDPTKALADSEERLLFFQQPFNNHNGGDLAFGPDGYLYIASGDGGSANDPFNNAQNVQSYLGKMLRIDVDTLEGYKVPATNPFVGVIGLDEIWSTGLRNPWRFSFDRMNGDMWIGDVGQNEWEEIDLEPAGSPGGANYGWRCYEADEEFNTDGCGSANEYTFPVWRYSNNRFVTGCSVTGGYVYRGSRYPDLFGYYIYADFCSGNFWGLNVANGDTTNIELGNFDNNQYVTFGEDINGELYVSAIQQGRIYKITLPCNLDITLEHTDETCPGSNDGSAQITLSDPQAQATVNWSTGDNGLNVDGLEPGVYAVEVSAGPCFFQDTFEVLASDLMMSCLIDTLFDDVYCDGDTVEIRACEAPEGYDYEWSQGDAVLPGQNDQVLRVTESGMYSVAFRGDCALGASQEVEVIFTPVPDKPTIVQLNDTLRAGISAQAYNWYYNGSFLETTVEDYIVAMQEGQYEVEGVNAGVCTGERSDVYPVILGGSSELYADILQIIPNPFEDRLIMNHTGDMAMTGILTDLNGKSLWSGSIQGHTEVALGDLPSGVYLLRLKGERGDAVMKLVRK